MELDPVQSGQPMPRPNAELYEVEHPFVDQLVGMGWKHTTGNPHTPSATGRRSFRDVLLEDDLRKALRRINPGPDGEPWLDDARISTAVSALKRLGAVDLLEANHAATERLWNGIEVPGLEGWIGGRDRTIHYIDWDTPRNNTFRVVDQFRVDEPGSGGRRYIQADLVLFVNGIPLVVVECKSPTIREPVAEAIEQLHRYANRRHWVDAQEGNERLFHTNQILVATSFDEARAATLSARDVDFMAWKDTSPVPTGEVAAALGKEKLSSQETLVAGMLHPEHLLDLVRHFTVFAEKGGKRVKLMARYQQFRAVHKALERLRTGKTRREDGEQDRRGGIVWHTQGSGKSLTMVFLVRKMRSMPDLRRFKIVVVTDRKDLEKQLSQTARLTGEPLSVAKSTKSLMPTLRRKGSGLIFAMIQKYRDPEEETRIGTLPVLNEDESILVLVDEAHRSHTSELHANLLKALPNCAKIGFTGTPILMGDKKRTRRIFGEFIDRYTLQQSEADGSTVPILYEGRTTEAVVEDEGGLDRLFEDLFMDRTPEELERIKTKYATTGHVLEARKLIRAKAEDMLRHYVTNILPNGLKAQVAAVSREATIRYRDAFLEARAELVENLEGLDPDVLALGEDEVESLPEETRFLVRAHPYLETLRALEFAPVISGGHNDTVDPKRLWSAKPRQDAHVERFKKPLFADDLKARDPLAFLLVRTMLLTGFDAPVEGVLYLDRPIKEHELLQAIARVNRTYDTTKKAGIVVDYYGIARHLQEALAAYNPEDVQGMLQSLTDEIPKLRDRHRRVVNLFRERGVEDLDDAPACVELLRDERLRAEFHVKLRQFLETLDLVLPRPEALPFTGDAKRLAWIQARARNLYRTDDRPLERDVGAKVRRLIDDHVLARGIDSSVPPISILDAEFDDHVMRQASPRAQASEMEHALRYHIRKRLDEDPEHYEALSRRLDRILTELEGRWQELVEALRHLKEEAAAGREEDDTGLDPETQAPFLGLLRTAFVDGDEELDPELLHRLVLLTVDVTDHIRQEIGVVDFWKRPTAQKGLSTWIVRRLDEEDLLPWEELHSLADRIVELAKVNRHKLTAP